MGFFHWHNTVSDFPTDSKFTTRIDDYINIDECVRIEFAFQVLDKFIETRVNTGEGGGSNEEEEDYGESKSGIIEECHIAVEESN